MSVIRFRLDGCDINFIAEAPEDITLKELLAQCDRIEPDWCACGIRSLEAYENAYDTEIVITKDDVQKTSEDVSCKIHENAEWRKEE